MSDATSGSARAGMRRSPGNGTGGAERDFGGLYPFLYSGEGDVEAVLDEVRRSTVEKADETLALRERVVEHYRDQLVACGERMARSFAAGGRLLAFGNGGSSTDAQSVVQTFLQPDRGRPLPATSLTSDVATMTALANDIGFEVVFARQIAAAGRPQDLAVGLSTSGGSGNVLSGFEEASRKGLTTIGLAGYEGGRMAALAEEGALDYLFVVPSSSIHRIQESQTTVYNLLWELTQRGLELLEEEAAIAG